MQIAFCGGRVLICSMCNLRLYRFLRAACSFPNNTTEREKKNMQMFLLPHFEWRAFSFSCTIFSYYFPLFLLFLLYFRHYLRCDVAFRAYRKSIFAKSIIVIFFPVTLEGVLLSRFLLPSSVILFHFSFSPRFNLNLKFFLPFLDPIVFDRSE